MAQARGEVSLEISLIKRLFGRPIRVFLAQWILRREAQSFYLAEAQLALQIQGFAPSATATELRVFTGAEMLVEVPDGNRVYFTMRDSSLWPAFEAIAVAVGLPAVERESADHSGHP